MEGGLCRGAVARRWHADVRTEPQASADNSGPYLSQKRSLLRQIFFYFFPSIYAGKTILKLISKSEYSYLTYIMSFETIWRDMTTPPLSANKQEQKKRLLKAKIAVALQDELGRVPKTEEIEQVFFLSRVMYKAILGLHYKRKEQKKAGQLVAGAKFETAEIIRP